MKRAPRSGCPIASTLDLIGDRWTLLVVRDLVFMGKQLFSEFLSSPEGISTNVLSERLRRLEEAGVVGSAPDPEDGRRVRYRLTGAGLDLIPILLELGRWGALHDPEATPPAAFVARYRDDRAGLIAELRARHEP